MFFSRGSGLFFTLLCQIGWSAKSLAFSDIVVDGVTYPSTKSAGAAIKDYSQVVIKEGRHVGELKIDANDVNVMGVDGAIVSIDEKSARGFFVISGQRVSIKNVACEGKLANNRSACVWSNGNDLELYNMTFLYQGLAIVDIAKQGTLTIDSCVFEGGGLGRKKTVVDAASPHLVIYNSQFKGAAKGAQLIRAKSYQTEIYNSYLYADNQTGRLVDFPYGGKVKIEGNLIFQSSYAKVFHGIAYGSSVFGRKRVHHFSVKNNLILLERKKGSAFLGEYPKNKSIPIEINNNVFIGKLKDKEKVELTNLVLADRKVAELSINKVPDFTKVAQYLDYIRFLHSE